MDDTSVVLKDQTVAISSSVLGISKILVRKKRK